MIWWAFSKIDFSEFASTIAGINLFWLVASMSLLVPQVFVIVVRLRLLAKKETDLKFMDALKISMSGGLLNTVMPSKGGDLAKAVFFKKLGVMNLTEATGLVIFEKATDVFALCAFTAFGIIMMGYVFSAFGVPILLFALGFMAVCATMFFVKADFLLNKGGRIRTVIRNMYLFFLRVRSDKPLLGRILLLAMGSWVIQLVQFWILFLAFGYVVNPLVVAALVPTALLISQIPVTISGWGLRENAMLVLFAPFAPAEVILGVSVLSSLRYYLPAIFAAPFFYSVIK